MTENPAVGPMLVARRWDQVDGLCMHTRTLAPAFRDGTPAAGPAHELVLLHGLGISSRYMVPLLGLLGADHRVLAPELPASAAAAGRRGP